MTVSPDSHRELRFDLGPGDQRLFIDESLEQIDRIESGLLELERADADPAVVNEVFRAAHTLKGSAATIGHERMTGLTHAMEDVFGALRSGLIAEVGPFADVLLGTIDVLRLLVEEVTTGRPMTSEPEALTAELRRRLTAAETDGAASDEHAASAFAITAATPASDGGPSDAAGTGHAPGDARPDTRIDALIASAPPTDLVRSVLTCEVGTASEWHAVRLLQAVVEADDAGVLVASSPTMDEIETSPVGRRLAMLLDGRPDDLEPLRHRLATIEDIEDIAVVAIASPADHEPGAIPPARPHEEAVIDERLIDLGPEARGIPPSDRPQLPADRLKVTQATIRIDVSRLDELMNLVGELVVHKTRLARHAAQLSASLGDSPLAREAEASAQQFSRIAGQLQDQVTALRMLPIETVFGRFPRVVRDICARLGKDVELLVDGAETELDRSVLEEVGDPLGHLVRNALDHGIEMPEERIAAGKDPIGRVRLSARHADGMIEISVEDDGRGMDPAELRKKAVEKGLAAEAAAALSDDDALRLIFVPGFSTAARVTDVSGRGVGMDVVRTNIERLGGRVDVHSTPGEGSQIVLSLPLTLAIVGAMLVRSGGRVCALPLAGVVETIRVDARQISRVGGAPVISLRGRVVPVDVLDHALGDGPRPLPVTERGFLNLAVVRARDAELALAVDAFVGEEEIVLKSMTTFTARLVGISGGTILADGTVALVVDIGALIERRVGRAAA